MPKKYIPIPKDQQKKRGPKSKEETIVIDEPKQEILPEEKPVESSPVEIEPIVEQEVKEIPAPNPVEPEIVDNKTNDFVSSDIPSDLDSIISDYSNAGPQNQNTEGPSSAERIDAIHGASAPVAQPAAPKISLVRGYMILLVLDFVLPMGITFLLKKTNNPKFKNIKPKDIKLTDDEFDDLEPVADEVAKDVQLNLSPMTQLFLGMSIIYGGKILTLDK